MFRLGVHTGVDDKKGDPVGPMSKAPTAISWVDHLAWLGRRCVHRNVHAFGSVLNGHIYIDTRELW